VLLASTGLVALLAFALFVVIATHVGHDLAAGWNAAIGVSAGISLVGAGGVALAGRSARTRAAACATNGT